MIGMLVGNIERKGVADAEKMRADCGCAMSMDYIQHPNGVCFLNVFCFIARSSHAWVV